MDKKKGKSFLAELRDKLLGGGNPVHVEGDQYSGHYTQVFDVDGEEVEIESFNDEPQQMRWKKWRTNKDGDVI